MDGANKMLQRLCAVCYQYGVWDATELITRNARDYMFFDELNSAIWATVTLYYKVTKTALADFVSRVARCEFSLFSCFPQCVQCTYHPQLYRWVFTIQLSFCFVGVVVMSIFSSSLALRSCRCRMYRSQPMLMFHWYISQAHIEPHRSSALIRLPLAMKHKHIGIKAYLVQSIETATAICV